LDVKKVFKITSEDRLIHHIVKEIEDVIWHKFAACSQKSGYPIEQQVTILDLGGEIGKFLNKHVKSFLKLTTGIAQDFYPELLGKMFVINAPGFVSAISAVMKPMLDERTRQKIKILGKKYHKDLFEYIDPDQFPAELGGNCHCPGGCLVNSPGPWKDYIPKGLENKGDFSSQTSLETAVSSQAKMKQDSDDDDPNTGDAKNLTDDSDDDSDDSFDPLGRQRRSSSVGRTQRSRSNATISGYSSPSPKTLRKARTRTPSSFLSWDALPEVTRQRTIEEWEGGTIAGLGESNDGYAIEEDEEDLILSPGRSYLDHQLAIKSVAEDPLLDPEVVTFENGRLHKLNIDNGFHPLG